MTQATPVLLLLFVCGCATGKVTEHYAFPADPETVRAAVTEAASGLSWASHAASDGTLTLISPAPSSHQLDAAFAPDGLRLTGPGHAGRLEPSGPFLAAAVRQVVEAPGDEPPLTPRSAALAASLDFLLPAAGSLYARDFGREMYPGDSPVMILLARLAMDALGVELLLLSRPGMASAGSVFLVEGLTMLVLNRVLAVVMDQQSISIRNAAITLGVRVPTIAAVEREMKAATVER